MRSWPSCHEGPKASANHSKLLAASTATLTDLGLVQAPTRTPANGRMWKYTLLLPQSRSCWPAPGVVLQHWSSHGHGSVGAAATLSPCLQATVRIRQSVATRALWVKRLIIGSALYTFCLGRSGLLAMPAHRMAGR